MRRKTVTFIFILLGSFLLLANNVFSQSIKCDVNKLKVVKFNEHSQAVGELQKCLNSLGFSIKSGITNFFGRETQQALKNFYKQTLNIDVDGKIFGVKGLNWFKSNYSKLLSKPQEGFLIRVSSKEELKRKLAESMSYYDSFGSGQMSIFPVFTAPMVKLDSTRLSKETPPRYSETNVQVKGIDEPDIVKNDGLRIYFANNKPVLIRDEGVLVKTEIAVNVINAFPPKDMSLLANIVSENEEITKNLLLDKDNKILITFGYRTINAYNVADPPKPKKIWNYEYASNSDLLTARFYQGKIYLFLRTYLNRENPCPVSVLNNSVNSMVLSCIDFYVPREPIINDTSYSVFILDPKTGNVEKKVSFVGSLTNSIVYVSPKNIYLTYYYYENLNSYILDFFSNQLTDILPFDVVNRINKLKDYDISDEAKIFEIKLIFNKYISNLEDGQKFIVKVNDRLQSYLIKNLKDLEKTAVVKINVNDLEIKKTGYIPGRLLNQFSLDEDNDYLRTAVTLGEGGFSFGPIWLNVTSSNAVYILDENLNIVGGLENLGLTERVYSARFYGERGYLVTFRQVDPFYVLDLSDPQNPKLKGELKIPGYSSYLEELEDNLVLGIGQEGSKVKVSLFDVSDPAQPRELDKYILKENWSDVLGNHHAFLRDERYKIFFLPSYKRSYIFSYADKKLKLEKEINSLQDNSQIERAIYIDNYLYLISQEEIIVLDENNWQEEARLKLTN